MGNTQLISGNSLFCIGVNYKNANETIRGIYSLNSSQIKNLLSDYKKEGIKSAIVISTCNRTEVYGLVQHPFLLIKQFIKHTKGDINVFENIAYIHKSNRAVHHLFNVGAGLDSQILGDFEIVSQLKISFNLSKNQNLVDPFLERLYNSVIQASKRIKRETQISSGTTSVAFAAVQYILRNFENPSNQNVLLFGTGKIGRNTCENLVKHIDNKHITLINRTEEKAQDIAGKFHLTYKPYEQIVEELSKTNILVVATSASKPTIFKNLLPKNKKMLILDLSIPKNVNEDVQQLESVKVLNIDYLSKITDKTLESRKASIPDALKIINEVKSDFDKWLNARKFAPTIQALKEKLNNIKKAEIDFQIKKNKVLDAHNINLFADNFIQKITTRFANHLKQNQNNPEESLKVFQQVFQLENEKSSENRNSQ